VDVNGSGERRENILTKNLSMLHHGTTIENISKSVGEQIPHILAFPAILPLIEIM